MKIDDFRHFFVQNPSGKTPGKPPENPRNFGGKFPRFFLGSALETGVPRGEIRGKSGGKSGGNFPEIPKFPEIPGNFGQKRAVFGNFDTLLRSELFFRSCWRAKTEKKKVKIQASLGTRSREIARNFPPKNRRFLKKWHRIPENAFFENG